MRKEKPISEGWAHPRAQSELEREAPFEPSLGRAQPVTQIETCHPEQKPMILRFQARDLTVPSANIGVGQDRPLGSHKRRRISRIKP